MNEHTTPKQQRTLWVTAWGVVLGASAAFTLGYGASRRSDPSVGASRPPGWPLVVSLIVVAVSLWFVLAPRLHMWPFVKSPIESDDPESDPEAVEPDATAQPWLTDLTDADER